jgi:hypothetical protein
MLIIINSAAVQILDSLSGKCNVTPVLTTLHSLSGKFNIVRTGVTTLHLPDSESNVVRTGVSGNRIQNYVQPVCIALYYIRMRGIVVHSHGIT